MIKAGIIHKVRWTSSNNKAFKNYVDYIDRDEATRNYNFKKFSLYNDYMGNPKKSGSLFNMENDYFDEKGLKELKRKFSEAQHNNSPMWQEVFSFDNDWLEKHGLYDSKIHTVDEEKIRNAVRESMKFLIDNEELNNFVWSASLHYNTDNIHVHIAGVQLSNPKEYGYRKGKTLSGMKSKFANNLVSRRKEHNKINELIRENIIDDKDFLELKKDRVMKDKINEIIKKMPSDTRQWHYNYNTLYEVRPLLDELSKYYIDNYKKEDFKELEKNIDNEVQHLKETYGEGKEYKFDKFRYENYKETKMKDLYTRLGNSFLKDIKEEIKIAKKINSRQANSKGSFINFSKKDINRIKKSFNKELDNIKNQNRYQELQREIENNRGISM